MHSNHVRDYFLSAGIPAEEVSGTHVTTLMAGHGSKLEVLSSAQTKFVAYDTHLERAVGGVPVVGSIAWARFNAAGDVANESVFWPAIPAEVVAEAQRLQAAVSDAAALKQFRAQIESNSPVPLREDGRVVIRHTSWTALSAFRYRT